jgi:protein-tyrosine phosphatase
LDRRLLKEHGITHVLVLGSFLHEHYPEDFRYKTFEVEDDDKIDMSKIFINCFNFINNAESVYVHCFAGKSRSPALVIGYLMWREGRSFDDVYEDIREIRNCISINSGFKQILKTFELFLKAIDNKVEIYDSINLVLMKEQIIKRKVKSI